MRSRLLLLTVTIIQFCLLPCRGQPAPTLPSPQTTPLHTLRDKKTGLEFVWIPKGSFNMGFGSRDEEEFPQLGVDVEGFWLSKNVVTVRQYQAFCKQTNYSMPEPPSFNRAWRKKNHPIVGISWKDAAVFCRWAKLDLPSNSEWEYAARGGLVDKLYPWGDVFDPHKIHCSKKEYLDSGGTAPVGSYPANGYGLFDMMGNVLQWCKERVSYRHLGLHKHSYSSSGEGWQGYTIRGGSWAHLGSSMFLCAKQDAVLDDIRLINTWGLRCVYRPTDTKVLEQIQSVPSQYKHALHKQKPHLYRFELHPSGVLLVR